VASSETKRIARRYDRWSYLYDFFDAAGPLGRGERRWRTLAAVKASTCKGWILDAASGTGTMFKILGSQGLRRIVAIDASPKMVQKCKSESARVGIDASILLGDVTRLPLKDGSMACVVCVFSLTTIADPTGAVREFARVLKCGGRLVVLDTVRPDGRWARLFHRFLVPVARGFCKSRIDRELYPILVSSGELAVRSVETFAYGMVKIFELVKVEVPARTGE